MTEIIHQPCPYPSCGSSDAFSWNTTKQVGSCHSCGRGYPSREKTFDWVTTKYPLKNNRSNYTEVIEENMKQEYRDHRGITERTMRFFDVLTDIDDTGKEIRHGYKYPDGKSKYRIFPKTFTADPGLKSDMLWGMNRFNGGSAKSVTICEGELDAMSAFQMLGSKYPAVSLPGATPKKNLLENCYDWLNSFEKIYLSIDTDDKAEGFAIQLMNLFPGRVYKVNHDKYKDANEFLQAGAAISYTNAWHNARLFTPSNIFNSEEDFVSLYQETQDHSYIPTGIPELDKKILGLMQGHFTVIKAESGLGKSELMRYLEYNFIKNYPEVKFATWHLEETKLRSLLGVVSYHLNDNLTRKDLVKEKGREADVLAAIKHITNNTGYMQFHMKDGDGVDELLNQIRVLSQVYGCKYIFFEPISDTVTVADDKSRESILADLAVRLSKIAAELNVGIVSIGHTNETGEFKYCRMIGQRASVVIDLYRDRNSDNPIERNTTKLFIRKNRPCGLEGEAGSLYFNTDSFTLVVSDGGF
jgi:twinkle protein